MIEKLLRIIKNNFQEFILLSCIIFTSCDTTEPELIDYHNKILFTSSRSGSNQLFIVNPEGTNLKQLTSGEFSHSNGNWSPDASKISCNTDENWDVIKGEPITLIDLENNSVQQLTYGRSISWYPDGSKIFFNNWSGSGFIPIPPKLYCIDVNGKNETLISSVHVGEVSFSLDGQYIALVSKPDSNTRIVLFNYPQFSDSIYIGPESSVHPKWSNNGNEIVFSNKGIEAPNHYNIFIMNSDGTNVRQITHNTSNQHYYYPVWSPNDEKIIFLAFEIDGSTKSYLYMVNKDGSNLHKVLEDEFVTSCDWAK